MATTEQIGNDAIDRVNQMCDSLVARGTILLTVEVQDREAADEIFRWMYSEKDRKPMKAHLQQISWDSAVVSKSDAEALRMIREGEGGNA